MNTVITNGVKSQLKPATFMVRLALYKNEVYRLPRAWREVRVLTGRAWLTSGGEDILLARGESAVSSSRRDTALVSALGQVPLVLELLIVK
jgi:hypothetical protein